MNKVITLLLCCLFLSCHESSAVVKHKDGLTRLIDSLTIELQAIQNKNLLPGFALSIFTKDTILYKGGFGYSDIKSKKRYTTENVQIIASITKTFIGVSLMKAVENGQISLDSEINDILPFTVSNPNFPDKPITVRQLATHSSSISKTSDSDEGYRFEAPLLKKEFPEAHHPLLTKHNHTSDLTMAEYLKYKLDESGKWYENEVFNSSEPGTVYEYSNLGAALLAYCIELQTGQSFDKFTENTILRPLNMESSTWKLEDTDAKQHITYYNEILNEVPKYRIISYPDGGLYASVDDLTLYIQEMMKGYDGEGTILHADSFKEMMTKQYDNEELPDGLCWDLSMGVDLIGHAGNDFGTSTLAYFSPSTGIGRILFSNISLEKEELEDAYYGIYNLLFQYEFEKMISSTK